MARVKEWIMEKVWKHIRRSFLLLWLLTLYICDRLIDACGEYVGIIRKEPELFFGAALLLAGLLSFERGKYCDGNTADYLSCTRPATYYYFGWLNITLILLGVFFIMFWHFKRVERKK